MLHCIKGIPQEERTAEQAARPKRAPIKDTESKMDSIALRGEGKAAENSCRVRRLRA